MACRPVAEFGLIFSGNGITEEIKLYENCRHICSFLSQEINDSFQVKMYYYFPLSKDFVED